MYINAYIHSWLSLYVLLCPVAPWPGSPTAWLALLFPYCCTLFIWFYLCENNKNLIFLFCCLPWTALLFFFYVLPPFCCCCPGYALFGWSFAVRRQPEHTVRTVGWIWAKCCWVSRYVNSFIYNFSHWHTLNKYKKVWLVIYMTISLFYKIVFGSDYDLNQLSGLRLTSYIIIDGFCLKSWHNFQYFKEKFNYYC